MGGMRRVARPGRFVGGVLAVIGLIFVLVGVSVSVVVGREAKARTAETTGTITDIEVREWIDSDGDHRKSYDITVRFEDDDHVEYETQTKVGSSGHHEGDVVNIVYDPRDPAGNCTLASDNGFGRLFGIIFGSVGGVLAVVGIALLIVA